MIFCPGNGRFAYVAVPDEYSGASIRVDGHDAASSLKKDGVARFGPDGRRIAYVASNDGSYSLLVTDGKNQKDIRYGFGDAVSSLESFSTEGVVRGLVIAGSEVRIFEYAPAF
jgi:redox-sensitive bicupin YhaK (pirin superfamily)